MGVTCPNCGGSETRQIAPGFWECQEKDYVAEGHGRDSACRHRFHAGTRLGQSSRLCSCGTFAIGVCTVCGTWVCGDHSILWSGKGRLCLDDAEPLRQREAEERRQREDAASNASHQEMRRQQEQRRREETKREQRRRSQIGALVLIAAGVLLFSQGSRSDGFPIAGALLALALAHGRGYPIPMKDEPFWTVFWAVALGGLGGYIVSVAI